jgi:hypothetical protein
MAVDLGKKLEKHEMEARKVISLLKLEEIKARILAVTDTSGSIQNVLLRGTIQNALLRLFAVAKQFDDNNELDSYIFSSGFARLPEITMENYKDYVEKEILLKFNGGYSDYRKQKTSGLKSQISSIEKSLQGTGGFLGFGKKKPTNAAELLEELNKLRLALGEIENVPVDTRMNIFQGNNEVGIMTEIVRYYTKENPSKLPTYAIVISDGGVYDNDRIKEIIRSSSNLPIFWQFVGLGKANYGALEELDTLDGRVIDNANFFELDDIDKISDEELYKRLLGEFPAWIQAAKSHNIL